MFCVPQYVLCTATCFVYRNMFCVPQHVLCTVPRPWGRLSPYWKWVPETLLGVNAVSAWGWRPHHLYVLSVMGSGSLSFLEPSGPHRACYGTTLPLPLLANIAFICKGICSNDTYLWNYNCEWNNHVAYCAIRKSVGINGAKITIDLKETIQTAERRPLAGLPSYAAHFPPTELRHNYSVFS